MTANAQQAADRGVVGQRALEGSPASPRARPVRDASDADDPAWSEARGRFPIVIIGAGFSGLCMAIALKRAGIDSFVLLEKASDLGGVWRENTYPGACCDMPALLYSYSFEPNPRWSRYNAPQREILSYIRHCAAKYGIERHIRYGTRVERARFDAASGSWLVHTDAGAAPLRARALVVGNGTFHLPRLPEIPGRETFRGTAFHSAQWDHGCELAGKRVAVVGTAASALQFVPEIAPRVAQLQVYQRTPQWILPSPDRPTTARERAAFARFPWLMRLARALIYWRFEARVLAMKVEPRLMRYVERKAQAHLRATVADPALRRKLTPDYRMGCIRILFSDAYYPALARPNVELVTDPIAAITPRGVRTADGREREVDVIVYATGFRTTHNLTELHLAGPDGRELGPTFRQNAESYLGITVSGFPNLYLMRGPNTAVGFSSSIFMMEAQAHYILACVETLRATGARAMDVRPEAQAAFTRALHAEFRGSVWGSGCRSFHVDEQSGRNTYLWPGSSWDYWLRTRRVRLADFQLT